MLNKASLGDINALLGCPMELPKVFEEDNVNLYDDYDSDRAKKILDCYFICCNWIRENINAYCYLFNPLTTNSEGDEDLKGLVSVVFQKFSLFVIISCLNRLFNG